MKIRLLKDWMGFSKGQEFVDDDGVFRIDSIEENIAENSSTTTSYSGTFTKEVISEFADDLFEVVEDEDTLKEKSEIEQSFQNEVRKEEEPEAPSAEMRKEEEIKERLTKIYKDIEVLKNFNNDSDVIGNVVHVLENMAYSLEWVLGNINE
jgi:hypothetical protein